MNKILRKICIAGVLAGALANPLKAQDKGEERVYTTEVETSERDTSLFGTKETDLSGFAFSGFHSKYRADGGFVLSEGAVNQSLVEISANNVFFDGDNLGGYVWSNFDFNEGSLSEVDLAGTYRAKLTDNLTGSLELSLWDYPNEKIAPNHDVILRGNLTYTGLPVDVGVRLTQLFTAGQGREIVPTVSKTFDIGTLGDVKLSATPYVSTAYLNDFFDLNGFSNVQYGISLDAKKGNIGLQGYLEYQDGIMKDFKDGFVGGVRLSIGF